jgi:hypothetical protein
MYRMISTSMTLNLKLAGEIFPGGDSDFAAGDPGMGELEIGIPGSGPGPISLARSQLGRGREIPP